MEYAQKGRHRQASPLLSLCWLRRASENGGCLCDDHASNGKVDKNIRTFATTTAALLALVDWLASQQVTHVAMESTGVLWRPIYTVLEDQFELILANAHEIKALPGRKTDVRDCEWIADLLRHGLIRPSFIPAKPVRALRDLMRYRKSLVYQHTQEINRLRHPSWRRPTSN